MQIVTAVRYAGSNPDYVTVTVNDEFVESTDFATTALKENDVIEFLYFMGGGAN